MRRHNLASETRYDKVETQRLPTRINFANLRYLFTYTDVFKRCMLPKQVQKDWQNFSLPFKHKHAYPTNA